MSLAWKVAVTAVLFAVCAVAAVVLIVNLLGTPPTVDFTSEGSGQSINVTLQTVGAFGSGNHPDWVSYLVRSPQGQWVHTTVFQVPAHTRVNVTIINYDSGSPLRNQQLGQVTGTYGNVATLNGKPFRGHQLQRRATASATPSPSPRSASTCRCTATTRNANLCAAAPCTTSSPHKVIRFSFTSPGPGNYRWQCFVPCGSGWLFGNGGPMSTLGYMGGFMKVVA